VYIDLGFQKGSHAFTTTIKFMAISNAAKYTGIDIKGVGK
jgi:hypothetical protein